MKSWALAIFAALMIFSLDAVLPNLIASEIVPENINVFWGTIAIIFLSEFVSILDKSLSSISIEPLSGFINFNVLADISW